MCAKVILNFIYDFSDQSENKHLDYEASALKIEVPIQGISCYSLFRDTEFLITEHFCGLFFVDKQHTWRYKCCMSHMLIFICESHSDTRGWEPMTHDVLNT